MLREGGGRRRQYDDGGGGGDESGGRYFNNKRRKTIYADKAEDDPIKTIILEVGERDRGSMESSIESVAKMLEGDLGTQKAKILQLLTEVVTSLPDKCSVYSTLVGLLNARNYNLGGEYVESVVKTVKEQLRGEQWNLAQYSIRFISDLVNSHVISATSLLQLYDVFMEAAVDTSSPQVRRDWLVYTILNCLPWVGRELYDKKEQTVERLMITIDNYMKKRKRSHLALLRVWASDEPQPQEEYLDCLWAQIEKLKMDGWVETHIQRPYMSFDSILCEALQHNLPLIQLPPHQDPILYPLPRVVFRMFDYTDCPEGPVLPGAHSIERYLIEQELRDILNKHHETRRECAGALLDYPHDNRIPLEYMVVEVIFGEMLKLPNSEYLQVCYGSILIELCKRRPQIIPQVLAQTTELLFERLDSMQVSCIDRTVVWFSYHLSQFQFRWSWDDWAYVANLDSFNPKPKFFTEVVTKCIRLSYYERIVELLPTSLGSLIPPPCEPIYKFDADTGTTILGITQAIQLQAAFREKIPIDEMLVIMKQVPHPHDSDEESHNPLAIEIFAQTVFLLGSKTLTHAHSAISKYQALFRILVENEEGQLCVLKSAFDVWKNDSQMLAVVVDMLLKYQVVECGAVANWVFIKEMQPEFMRIYLWEVLHLTIRKMSKHVLRLQKELSEAKEKLRRAEMNSSDSETEEDGTAKMKDVKDIPTEEQVDKMEEKLETVQANQKNLFLIVFQRFIMILSEHIARCDTDGKNFNTPWYRWTIGRLQEVFMQHADQVAQYSSTLETLLFTQDLDKNILEIFEQFKSLRA